MLYAFSFGDWFGSLIGSGSGQGGDVTTLLPEPVGSIVQLLLAALGLASIIAKMTPTQVDDLWLSKIAKLIHFFGLTKTPPAPPA